MDAPKPPSQVLSGPPPPLSPSIWSFLQTGLSTNPNGAALISMQQPPTHLSRLVGPHPGPQPIQTPASLGPDQLLTWSYAQLSRGAARLATVLKRHDVPPESTIATFIPQSAESVLFLWAAAAARSMIITRSPEELLQEEKVGYYFETFGPAVVVVVDEEGVGVVDEMRMKHKQQGQFLGICLGVLKGEKREGWLSMAEIADMEFTEGESTVDPAAVNDRLDRPAHALFTSGTTGPMKCVPQTVKSLSAIAALLAPISRNPLAPQLVGIALSGSFGATAISLPYNAASGGGTAVVAGPRWFSCADVIRAIETCRVTWAVMVRYYASMLLQHGEAKPERFRSVRLVTVIGEIVTEGFLAEVQKMFENAVVIPGYGMTEGGTLFGWPEGAPSPLPSYQGIVSSGALLPGFRARIVDKNGEVVERGRQGELHAGGDVFIERYWGGVEADRFYEDEAGRWFRTGDIAMVDEEGYWYVVGRLKDRVRSIAGEEHGVFHPFALESSISTRFGVQAQVVGISTTMLNDVPFAILERLPEGVTEADIAEHCVNAMGTIYGLAGISSLEQLGMEGWPRTAETGKVSKKALQRVALQWLEKQEFTAYALGKST
ncbi:acetyl-CoA synthetase-like protein [Parathielavia appendiculata]|uniref:Acetyl-CoA synthetase-like protein n=1 Tax=Parathielavia appendiculata TaxID=2587402 RepID=A0AAN6Z2R2_9PEZI|nr:acetyl-CoA synthetase-like protein [Parathielavia appendiculata]